MNRKSRLVIPFILSAFVVVVSTACTSVAPENCEPVDSYATGTLRTQYLAKSPEYIGSVFNASKKALDQLGYFRTGETPGKDRVTIYARAHGDVSITVDIYKKVVETKEGAKQEWIFVSIRYGSWGNNKESQGIISKITANLK